MQFPPPPGLAFLAYASGSISKETYLKWVNLWHEKHTAKQDVAN